MQLVWVTLGCAWFDPWACGAAIAGGFPGRLQHELECCTVQNDNGRIYLV